mgnify:FL=1|tara:strand:- start:563 stop:913 length:351 start_codon:yes stop_codon:yes gene_type:complete
MSLEQDVKDFLIKFEMDCPKKGKFLSKTYHEQRFTHMIEELWEYCHAKTHEDKLDAIVDLVYIAIGTSILHGYDFTKAWQKVHEANMKKVRDKDVTFKSGISKPVGWKKPNLKDCV